MTTIRTMTEQDLSRVAALSEQLGYPVSLEALRARFMRLAGRDGERLFVAEHSGRVVGWLHVGMHDSLEADPCAIIVGLVVDGGGTAARGWTGPRRGPRGPRAGQGSQ